MSAGPQECEIKVVFNRINIPVKLITPEIDIKQCFTIVIVPPEPTAPRPNFSKNHAINTNLIAKFKILPPHIGGDLEETVAEDVDELFGYFIQHDFNQRTETLVGFPP